MGVLVSRTSRGQWWHKAVILTVAMTFNPAVLLTVTMTFNPAVILTVTMTFNFSDFSYTQLYFD